RARSRSPTPLETAWLATRMPPRSAAFMMRESMLPVIAVPSGLSGATQPLYVLTDRLVVVNVALLDSTLPIDVTSMLLLPPSASSHIGSPATESCMTAGRTLNVPLKAFWYERRLALGTPAARSLISTETTLA